MPLIITLLDITFAITPLAADTLLPLALTPPDGHTLDTHEPLRHYITTTDIYLILRCLHATSLPYCRRHYAATTPPLRGFTTPR